MKRRYGSKLIVTAAVVAVLCWPSEIRVLAAQAKTPTGTAAGTVIDTLASAGRFTTLIRIISAAGLTQTLRGKGPFTLFAPDDRAFSGLSKQSLEALLTDPRAARGFILPYILSGRITSQDMASPQSSGKPLETLAGTAGSIQRAGLLIIFDPPAPIEPAAKEFASAGSWPCCGWRVGPDQLASNGIIHVIAPDDGATAAAKHPEATTHRASPGDPPPAQTAPPKQANPAPLDAEVTAAQNRVTTVPLRPGTQTPASQPSHGLFRVTLNGFRVNHQSDDDILEGDGRGDEIFFTSNIWVVQHDGTDLSFRQNRSKVMGDPNGHPERIAAGTLTPGPFANLGDVAGGLQTGDTFPTREPWRRLREPLPDRPPLSLWQGVLTEGVDAVVILPIIWEWDSDDLSQSQQSVQRDLPRWFERQREAVKNCILAPASLDTPVRVPALTGPVGSTDALYPASANPFATPIDYIPLDGKPGTRPIGYEEASTPAMDLRGAVHATATDRLSPHELVLTYDSATRAAQAVTFGVRGVFEIRYVDAHDHGDYSIFVQIERLDHP